MHLDTASEKPLFWVCSQIASTCVTMCKYNIPEFWWNLRSVFECGSLIGFWTRRSNMSVNHSWFGQFGVIRIRSKFSDFTLFQAWAYQCGWWICICIHIVPWLERSIYFPCLWVWYRRYTCRFVILCSVSWQTDLSVVCPIHVFGILCWTLQDSFLFLSAQLICQYIHVSQNVSWDHCHIVLFGPVL